MKSILTLAALFLGACATPTTSQGLDAGPQPTAVQIDGVVQDYLRESLQDPDSVKQFQMVSGPTFLTWVRPLISGGGKDAAWLVCFAYNAKNSYGAYVGVKTDGMAIRQYVAGAPYVVVRDINWGTASSRC